MRVKSDDLHGIENQGEAAMGFPLMLLTVVLVLACLGAFGTWRRRLLIRVLGGSEIAATAWGPVEFARVGTRPVILQLHGGATGYDQTLALSWDAHEAGFAVREKKNARAESGTRE